MGWPSKDPAQYHDPATAGRPSFPLWKGSDQIVWTALSIGLRVLAVVLWVLFFALSSLFALGGAAVAIAAAWKLEAQAKRSDRTDLPWLMRPRWTNRDRYHQLSRIERWGLPAVVVVAGVTALNLDDEGWVVPAFCGLLVVAMVAYLELRLRRIRSS